MCSEEKSFILKYVEFVWVRSPVQLSKHEMVANWQLIINFNFCSFQVMIMTWKLIPRLDNQQLWPVLVKFIDANPRTLCPHQIR